jgi:hypothetical protein
MNPAGGFTCRRHDGCAQRPSHFSQGIALLALLALIAGRRLINVYMKEAAA